VPQALAVRPELQFPFKQHPELHAPVPLPVQLTQELETQGSPYGQSLYELQPQLVPFTQTGSALGHVLQLPLAPHAALVLPPWHPPSAPQQPAVHACVPSQPQVPEGRHALFDVHVRHRPPSVPQPEVPVPIMHVPASAEEQHPPLQG
jgi:hypothetical protein